MKKKIITIFFLSVVLIIYLLLEEHFIKCPINTVFKIYCPGCGMTRMLSSLLKGNFYQAFRYNPLVFICIPFVLLFYCIKGYFKRKNQSAKSKIFETYMCYILLTVFLIYGIVRNIPMFDYLAPTEI